MDQMEGKGRHRFRLWRAKKALVQAPLAQAVTVEGIGILEDGVDFLPCGIVLTTMTGDEVTPRLVVTVMKADGSEGLRMICLSTLLIYPILFANMSSESPRMTRAFFSLAPNRAFMSLLSIVIVFGLQM